MNEQYLASSFDEWYDDAEFALDYTPRTTHDQAARVDMTKKPTTPREASHQSEVYVRQLEDIESQFQNQVSNLEGEKMLAESHRLVNAETRHKFIVTICDELNEIKQTDDIGVRSSLWEDIIDLTSVTQYTNYVNITRTEKYTGKDTLVGYIERHYVTKVVRSAGEDAYWTPDGFSEDPIGIWDMTRKIIEEGVLDDSTLDTKGAHKRLLETRLGRIFGYPEYDILSSDMWQKINDTIVYTKELISHTQGSPISQGLANFLSELADDFLSTQQQDLVTANKEIQRQKEFAGLNEETIAERARAIIDEKQLPTLQEAREHTQRNVSLLRRAALAEAALDGVNIRRTASRKS